MTFRVVVFLSIVVWLVHWVITPSVIAQGKSAAPPDSPTVIGRWDVTVQGADGKYPSWFEIRKSGHKTLVGSYVGQFGSARPIARVEQQNGSIKFTVPPQWEDRPTDITYEGTLEGDIMRGDTTNDKGERI